MISDGGPSGCDSTSWRAISSRISRGILESIVGKVEGGNGRKD